MGEEPRRVQDLQLAHKDDAGRGRIQAGRLPHAVAQDPSEVGRVLKLVTEPLRRQLQQQEQRPPQEEATAQGIAGEKAAVVVAARAEGVRSDGGCHDCHFYFVLCGMIPANIVIKIIMSYHT